MSGEADPLAANHASRHAQIEERQGRPLVASYGDVLAEYRQARERAGLLHLGERDVLVARGPVRQKFLNGMLSNDILALGPGRGCRAALLTANGHVQALLRVLAEPDAVALEMDQLRLAGVQAALERHRVAAPVRFERQPTVVLALLGPAAPAVLAAAGLAPPPAEAEAHVGASIEGQAVRIVNAGDLAGPGLLLQLPPAAAPAAFERLVAAGALPVGRRAVDALRIEALRPWDGSDVTEANLLHETGLVRECHSAHKGCYLGQEIVARLEARGANVNKTLRGLLLTAPARAGEAIRSEGREVGQLTSTAVSPRLGPIALGYLQRGHNEHGTAVAVGGAPATVLTRFDEAA